MNKHTKEFYYEEPKHEFVLNEELQPAAAKVSRASVEKLLRNAFIVSEEMHHLGRKSSPSLSINSCRALKEPDCRGSWGSSSSFCNIRYTSESSMLVSVLGLSMRDTKIQIHVASYTNETNG